MKKLVIWGASGHATVVADIVRLMGRYEIAGFLDDLKPSPRRAFCGSWIVGGSDHLDSLRAAGVDMAIIAVGDCRIRTHLARVAAERGFTLATVVHPRATIASDAGIGGGTVIAAGAVINPGVLIGENVIINTSASVDHDCVIGDGAHIGPGCHLGGWTRVGRESWLGIGATVRDRVVIGNRTVVGAGAVVVGDLPDEVLSYGVPARVIGKIGERTPVGARAIGAASTCSEPASCFQESRDKV